MLKATTRKFNQPSADVLPVDLSVLSSLSVGELVSIWQRQLGKTAPSGLPRSLLARSLAYQLQIPKMGGLQREVIRILDRVADNLEAGGKADVPSVPEKKIKPGSVLVREHGGTLHRVMVMAEGFIWDGKTYPSLSAVAKAITGTNWNGNTFFGIRKRDPAQRNVRPETAT